MLIVGWSLPWEHYLDHPADTDSGFEIALGNGMTIAVLPVFWLVVSIVAVVAGMARYAATGREAWTLAVFAAPTVAFGLIALFFSVLSLDVNSSPDSLFGANGGVYVAIAGSAMLLISGLLMVVAAVRRRLNRLGLDETSARSR